jgi:hypothetical protein
MSTNQLVHVFMIMVSALVIAGTAQSQWNWQSPVPQGNTLNNVQFSDSIIGGRSASDSTNRNPSHRERLECTFL